MARIVITGSSGLIGGALAAALAGQGHGVIGIDQRPGPHTGMVRRLTPEDRLSELLGNVSGVIHLAGMTRVKWGEADPAGCWAGNVGLTSALVDAALAAPGAPWLIYASSREVYGRPCRFPVDDDAPIAPVNVYGASKAAAEALIGHAAAHSGLNAAILRFSTVYGGIDDHPDRLFPAFLHAALEGRSLTIEGEDVTVDPTWIGDAIEATVSLVGALDAGAHPPGPILLAGGVETRLDALAGMILAATGSGSAISQRPPRTYDVMRFASRPRIAAAFLGWRARTPLAEGIARYAALMTERRRT